MSTEIVGSKSTRTRPAKPGMVRVVVSLTQEHHDYLEAQAKQESPVFPRPVNEHLSIGLAKSWEFMKQQDAIKGQVQTNSGSAVTDPNRQTLTFSNTKQ